MVTVELGVLRGGVAARAMGGTEEELGAGDLEARTGWGKVGKSFGVDRWC